jgi:UPF0755 protein
MTRYLILLGSLGVAVAVALGWRLWADLNQPMPIGDDGYVFEVATGRTLTSVARELGQQGLLEHPRSLAWYGRLAGLAEKIQAGEYHLVTGTTPVTMLEQLVNGRVKLHSLTVVEGWTIRELLAAIRAHPALRQTLNEPSPAELVALLNLDVPHPEGMFFPDTYAFPRGISDVELLRQARDLMRRHLDEAWASRRGELPLQNAYEALILASIVERETALDSERAQVAGVFVRRLQRGMRLQTDPTVIYGLGASFDGNLRKRDLQSDTPYNTYTRAGLPPTPIALPGKRSLEAAVNPDQGSAIYFVATGLDDGSHYFAETLEEHNAAVGRYLARLREQGQ